MEQLWIGVCNRGIAAGWLILAILVFRLLFRSGFKRVRLYLWAVVALRLLMPALPESNFCLVPGAAVIPPDIGTMERPMIESGLQAVDEAVNPVLGARMQAAKFGPDENPMQRALAWATLLWLTGMAVLAGYSLLADVRLRLHLRDAVLTEKKELYGIRGEPYDTVFVYSSEKVSVPFTAGIVHPRIYLPFLPEEERKEHVIAHEMAHITHRDPWIKLLGWGLMIVFWFCPVMWLGWFAFERDMELACDERVAKGLSKEGRCSYSETLLACSRGRRELTGPLAFGAGDVKARVKSVLHYRRPTLPAVLTAVALCAAAVLCFATNPVGGAIELPQKEHIIGVQLEIMRENSSMFTKVLTETDGIGEILEAMEGAKKIKSSNSAKPKPDGQDGGSYAAISWMRDDFGEEKWYFYSRNGNYYLEQPYGGIYQTDKDCFLKFGELAGSLDDQEWVSFTYHLFCFHADGAVERSETLGGRNAKPLQAVTEAYARKLVSSGAGEQKQLQEKLKNRTELSGTEKLPQGMGPQPAGVLYDRESVDLQALDCYYRISWRNDKNGPENMLYVYEIDGEPYMHMETDTEGIFLLERKLYEAMKNCLQDNAGI